MYKLQLTDFYDIVEVTDEKLHLMMKKDFDTLYKKILKTMNSLRGLGFTVDLIPLPLSRGGIYWTDYANSYLINKHSRDYTDKKYMYFTVYLDVDGAAVNTNKYISVNFIPMKKDDKEKVVHILQKYVPNHYEWGGTNNKQICIHFDEGQYKQAYIHSLKDDDTYPMLRLNIYTVSRAGFAVDLPIFEELLEVIKNFEYDYSCGIQDIDLEILAIDKDSMFLLFEQIMHIMKEHKKSKSIKKYSIEYCENDNKSYNLLIKTGMEKFKKIFIENSL